MKLFLAEGTTLHEAASKASEVLFSCGVEDARTDAWYLLESVTGLSRAEYLAEPKKLMSKEQRDAYTAAVNLRGSHIPLQHIIGEQEFMGLTFTVNDKVLIPRQDTETLVETALAQLSKEQMPAESQTVQILEIGTGSGCIAVSMEELWEKKRNYAGAEPLPVLEITASDLSEEALDVAKENAYRILDPLLRNRVHFIKSDLFDQIPRPSTGFAMILSNPPYIRTKDIAALDEEVRTHEPLMALDGGADGLTFYQRIVRKSPDFLMPGGQLLFEIGFDQGAAVKKMMKENEFFDVKIQKDLSGNNRVVFGCWEAEHV